MKRNNTPQIVASHKSYLAEISSNLNLLLFCTKTALQRGVNLKCHICKNWVIPILICAHEARKSTGNMSLVNLYRE